jgi:hypothetical protein
MVRAQIWNPERKIGVLTAEISRSADRKGIVEVSEPAERAQPSCEKKQGFNRRDLRERRPEGDCGGLGACEEGATELVRRNRDLTAEISESADQEGIAE